MALHMIGRRKALWCQVIKVIVYILSLCSLCIGIFNLSQICLFLKQEQILLVLKCLIY